MRLMKYFNALESRIEDSVGADRVKDAIEVMARVELLSDEVQSL
jgi:hypothetical protein